MKPEIILDTILVFIGLYLALFKSYFQEKGKNIATSEDIEELTYKVESIKQDFSEKNSSLKAKLDLLTNLQINHQNEKRNSLIEFHRSIKSWIGLLTESSPSLIDDYDNQEIQGKIFQYSFFYSKMLGAEALLELYVDDDKLYELIFDLKNSVLEHLAPHPIKFLLDLKFSNFEFEQLKELPMDTPANISKKVEKQEELFKKRIEIFSLYRTSMINGYKEVINYDIKYRSYIKEYITEISAE